MKTSSQILEEEIAESKLLADQSQSPRERRIHESAILALSLALSRIEKEGEPTGWIPVSERLPTEDHVYVLGANSKTKFVGEMNWEYDYGFRHYMMPGQTITHWQYFPLPPTN